jgi:hypothetical protein
MTMHGKAPHQTRTGVSRRTFIGSLEAGALAMDKNGGIFGVTAAPYLQPPSGTVYWLAAK